MSTRAAQVVIGALDDWAPDGENILVPEEDQEEDPPLAKILLIIGDKVVETWLPPLPPEPPVPTPLTPAEIHSLTVEAQRRREGHEEATRNYQTGKYNPSDDSWPGDPDGPEGAMF